MPSGQDTIILKLVMDGALSTGVKTTGSATYTVPCNLEVIRAFAYVGTVGTVQATIVNAQVTPISGAAAYQLYTSTSDTFTDGVTTSGSTTMTSATAAFVAGDVGRSLTGTNIAAGSYVASVQSATSITMNYAATGSGTGQTFVIGRRVSIPISGHSSLSTNGVSPALTIQPPVAPDNINLIEGDLLQLNVIQIGTSVADLSLVLHCEKN